MRKPDREVAGEGVSMPRPRLRHRVLLWLLRSYLRRYIAELYDRSEYYRLDTGEFSMGAGYGVDYAAMLMEDILAKGDVSLSERTNQWKKEQKGDP